jgi:hypothetical protein
MQKTARENEGYHQYYAGQLQENRIFNQALRTSHSIPELDSTYWERSIRLHNAGQAIEAFRFSPLLKNNNK